MTKEQAQSILYRQLAKEFGCAIFRLFPMTSKSF